MSRETRSTANTPRQSKRRSSLRATPVTAVKKATGTRTSTPAVKRTTPAGKRATPAGKRTTPAGKRATPAGKRATPARTKTKAATTVAIRGKKIDTENAAKGTPQKATSITRKKDAEHTCNIDQGAIPEHTPGPFMSNDQMHAMEQSNPMISSFEEHHQGTAAHALPGRNVENIDYTLRHVLAAHSANECDDDDFTDIWDCTFPPPMAASYHRTSRVDTPHPTRKTHTDRSTGCDPTHALDPHVVATCGGDIVCFTDCRTAKVVLKYKHLDEDEEFYSIAWTVAPAPSVAEQGLEEDKENASASGPGAAKDVTASSVLQSGVRFWSIVATAGKGKSIRLIDVKQKTCYKYITGHQGDVHDLKFIPARPMCLLSASNDGSIRLWDIAAKCKSFDPATASPACLGVYEAHSLPPVCLSVSPDGSSYLAGLKEYKRKDEAPIVYQPLNCTTSPTTTPATKTPKKRGRPKTPSNGIAGKPWIVENLHETTLDTICHLDQNIVVSKGAMDGIVRVWNLQSVLEERRVPQDASDIPVIATIKSPYNHAERCFFMKGTVHRHGPDPFDVTYVDVRIDGTIALSDLGGLSGMRHQLDTPVYCDKILKHDLSCDILHKAAVSVDAKWLVSVAGNNRIFIWAQEKADD